MVSVVWLRARRGWRVVSQLGILIISPLAVILRKEVIVIIIPVVIILETTREIVHTTLINPFILACVEIISVIAETVL